MARKLLGLSLLAILLLAGSAFALNVNVYFGGTFTGNTWHDTMYVPINSPWNQATLVDVPVYGLSDEGAQIANCHVCLGVKDIYIDDVPLAACNFSSYFPFNYPGHVPDTGAGWDDNSFLGTYAGVPPNPVGLHSRSFLGFADLGGTANMFLYPFPNAAQFLRFGAHFIAVDTNVVYDPFADGFNTQNGGTNFGDPNGGAGYPAINHYAKVKFVAIHNLPPVIGPIADITNHASPCVTFTVTDADGPAPLTVVADHGVVTHVSGDQYQLCVTGYCGDVIVTATDGAAAVTTATTHVLNAAPVIVYSGANPVLVTGAQAFSITDANNDVITYSVSGTCAVTITTNVPGHIAGSIYCTSACQGTITINANDPCAAQAEPVSFVNNVTNGIPVFVGLPTYQNICLSHNTCYNFTVTDDIIGNQLLVTATNATVTQISYHRDALGAVWTGTICVNPVCANDGILTVVVTADDGAGGITTTNLTFAENATIQVDMPDSNMFWPGYVDSIPVVMRANCLCLGGYELTVMYDNTIWNVIRVDRGPVSLGAEYFYTNYNPPVSYCAENGGRTGALKVVMIWDLNNQIPNPCQNVQDSILFWIVGEVPNGNYQTNYCVPICFYMCGTDCGGFNYQWNAITDASGAYVWKTEGCCDNDPFTYYLDLHCGNIKIQNPQDVIPGDVNHNGQRYEIGDVVALANYLGDPTHSPLHNDRWAWWASDINQDGVPGTIADLVMLIRIVTNQIPVPHPGNKVAPIDVTANANLSGSNLTINADANLGGAVVTISHDGEIGVPTANGMDIKYSDLNGVMTVLAYSLAGNALGNNITINVPVVSGTATLASASVADINGAMLNARVTAPLPTEFSVAQNYPNPFNVKTAIQVALPTPTNVTISIYNVAGQLVQTINTGNLDAGTHSIIWDASNAGSGVYFYKVVAGDQTKTLKMTLLK